MKRKLIVMAMAALLAFMPIIDAGQNFNAYAETKQITETGDDTSVSVSDPDKAVVTISKAKLKKFRDGTKKTLKLTTQMGSVTLDKTLAKSLVSKAKGKKIDIVMEKAKLSEEQTKLFGENAMGRKIYFKSAGKTISNPKSSGAKATFLIYLPDETVKPDAVCRQITGGKIYRNKFTLTEEENNGAKYLRCDVNGSLQGTFFIGEKEPIDRAYIISGVRNTTIKAKVVKAEKAQSGRLSYVKLDWTKSKGVKLDGYEIFDSYNKISYQKAYTLEGSECYNRNIESDTTKYYKIRGYRIIKGVPYYTRWSNVVSGTV